MLGVSLWVTVLLDKCLFYRPTYRLLADWRSHGLDPSLGNPDRRPEADGAALLEPVYEALVRRGGRSWRAWATNGTSARSQNGRGDVRMRARRRTHQSHVAWSRSDEEFQLQTPRPAWDAAWDRVRAERKQTGLPNTYKLMPFRTFSFQKPRTRPPRRRITCQETTICCEIDLLDQA